MHGILAHRVAAVRADDAFPVGEWDEGRVGIVVLEHATGEHEEVAQPSAGERGLHRGPAVASAELLVADVRMCDVAVGRGGMRIKG